MTREALKGRQLNVYNFIRDYQGDNDGATPSYETISRGTEIHSSSMHGLITALVAHAWIARAEGGSSQLRAITFLDEGVE